MDGKLGGNSVPGETLFIGPILGDRKGGADSVDLDEPEDDQGWKVNDGVGGKVVDIEGKYGLNLSVSLALKLGCSSTGSIFSSTLTSRRPMPMTTCWRTSSINIARS